MKYFFLFVNTGSNSDDLIASCKKIIQRSFEVGSDIEILLSRYIYAVILRKIENSCWTNLPKFSEISDEKWKPVIKKNAFIKELWPAQMLLGKENVFKGQSAVIQMPTSAGKTKSTEIIIRSAFMSQRTNIAVVLAPFRALCNEIQLDYSKSFFGEKDIEINAISDAFDNDDVDAFTDCQKKHIIVLTPEKFYYLLAQKKDLAEKIKLIIYDEGHQFDNNERGVTYELLLTELNNFLPSDSQKVLISAVIHNAEEISNWLMNNDKVVRGMNTSPTIRNIGFVTDSFQIEFVNQKHPDKMEFFVPRTIIPYKYHVNSFFPAIDKPREVASYFALKLCSKNMVAIYVHRKDWLSKMLQEMIDVIDNIPEISKPSIYCDSDEIKKILNIVKRNMGEQELLYHAIKYGIFPHHTSIPEGIRNSIEFAAHESLIKIIVCTSTLAQGVNLPIKYLFVTTNQQGDGYFKIRDFHNFIGRVGRAGKLTEGSIIFTDTNLKKNTKVWYHIKNLLNADLSENCSSSLLEIFSPLYDRNGKNTKLNFKDLETLVDFYYDETLTIETLADKIIQSHREFEKKSLIKQISIKYLYIGKIENFLMILGEYLNEEVLKSIAKSTLAYHLAESKIKEKIESLFVLIGRKFIEQSIKKEKMQKYAKTLLSLNSSIQLENRIIEIYHLIKDANNTIELFKNIWNIFDQHISNVRYRYISDREKVKQSVFGWVNGVSYKKLYKILNNQKISSNRKMSMEYCVEIFEGGISFEGATILNSIKELLPENGLNESLNRLFDQLEKQVKYGLPDIKSVNLYELGFRDRCVAQELSALITEGDNKSSIRLELLEKKDIVCQLLSNYPSYFMNIFERIIKKVS